MLKHISGLLSLSVLPDLLTRIRCATVTLVVIIICATCHVIIIIIMIIIMITYVYQSRIRFTVGRSACGQRMPVPEFMSKTDPS